jgi:hypothetical protein
MSIQFQKVLKLGGISILTLMFVSGCKTVSLNNYCDLYEPVYSRATDRQELRDNINRNNAVYLELCIKDDE